MSRRVYRRRHRHSQQQTLCFLQLLAWCPPLPALLVLLQLITLHVRGVSGLLQSSTSCHRILVQDLDVERAAKITGKGPRAEAVLQAWKARQKAFASPAAAQELKPNASMRERCDFSERHGLACVQAEQPLGVLGAVSELFGDKLWDFMRASGMKKDKLFRKAMQLRCGALRPPD